MPTEFECCQINTGTLQNNLRCMKIDKAAGHDMLPAKLLKLGCDILCLTYIMNMCFSSGIFPCNLKCADVCPVFKKGDTMEMRLRPVIVLPSVSKIFEDELVNHVSEYFQDIVCHIIYGFRKKHSCETVLMRMVENVKKILDDGKIVCAILMDLSKAFDCIPHKLLITKFRA